MFIVIAIFVDIAIFLGVVVCVIAAVCALMCVRLERMELEEILLSKNRDNDVPSLITLSRILDEDPKKCSMCVAHPFFVSTDHRNQSGE